MAEAFNKSWHGLWLLRKSTKSTGKNNARKSQETLDLTPFMVANWYLSYRACGSSYQFIIAPQENMATAFFEEMINWMNQLIIGYNGSWIMVHTIFLKFWSHPKFGKRSLSLSNPLILSHEMIRIRYTKAGRKGNIASIRHSPIKSYWALAEKDQQELSSIDGKTGWRL